MDHSWLTDEQSAKIAPHLPTDTRGKERVDDPRVIGGIGHGLKSGGRRADAPREIYGPKKTLTASCAGQASTGGLFEALAQAGGPPAQGLIDASGVEAHRCSTGGEGENRCGQAGARAVDARPGSTRPPRPRLPPARFPADRRADRRLHGWCGRFLGSPADDHGLMGPFARTVVLPRRATL